MSTIEIKEFLLSKKIFCLAMGHKFIPSRKITNHIHEYKCSVCDLEFTDDDEGNKTFLTPELKDINETLFQFCQKKLQRV